MKKFCTVVILLVALIFPVIFGFKASNLIKRCDISKIGSSTYRCKSSDDSSEIEWESSSSLAAKQAAKAKEIADRKAAAELAAKLAADIERRASEEEAARLKSEWKITTKAVVPAPVSTVNTVNTQPGLSANQNSAFDVGLLIAFPLLIGTQGFFIFFPLIGEKLANSIP